MCRIFSCLFPLLVFATIAPAIAVDSTPAKAPAKPAAQSSAPPAMPDTAPVPAGALEGTPNQLYGWATDHLEAGLWYERAMTQLKAALAKDPQNMQYHLTLGCAEADRAASIGYALSWRDTLTALQGVYPMELDMWQKGQKDPKSFEYGAPKPQPPPKFSIWTKDDYKELKITDAQATARIAELNKAAKGEWSLALTLCKGPQEKALVEYVQGWGLRLTDRTQNSGGAMAMASEMSELFGSASDTDAVKSLEAATKDDPGTAAYWQSVGDALYRDPELSALMTIIPGASGPPEKPSDISALEAYQHALKINSGNPMLWYRVAMLDKKANPTQALAELKQAASGEPDNAYMAYEAAGWELDQSKFADAFNLLDIIKRASANAEKGKNDSGAAANDASPDAQNDTPADAGSPADTPDTSSTTQSTTVTNGITVITQSGGAPAQENSGNDTNTSNSGGSDQSQADVSSPFDVEGWAKKGADAYQDEPSRELAMQAVALVEQGNDEPDYRAPVYLPAVPKILAVAWGYGNQVNIDPAGGIDSMQTAGALCEFAEAVAKSGDTDDGTRAARAVIAMGLKMMSGLQTGKGITGLGTGASVVLMGYSALEKIYREAGDQDMASQVKAEETAFETQMKTSMMQAMQNWMQSFFGSY
ncbi:MAG TPA: hypothetical protein VFW40_02430 [Capsulimonadaceae bacterium]|nr:hypothetical protein [Capsulimonadaceae bacterium]